MKIMRPPWPLHKREWFDLPMDEVIRVLRREQERSDYWAAWLRGKHPHVHLIISYCDGSKIVKGGVFP